MQNGEIFNQALRNMKSNMLRASLTLFIIAFGIMALVGILTALDSIIFSLSQNFSGLGANSFSIVRTYEGRRGPRRSEQQADAVSYRQAQEFKSRFDAGLVGVDLDCTSSATLKTGEKKTNPNVSVLGIDEQYFVNQNAKFSAGRPFTTDELQRGAACVILGSDMVKLLFSGNPNLAIGKTVNVNNANYSVVGVLEEKGSSMQQSSDRMAFIPLWTAKNQYNSDKSNYNITVGMKDPTQIGDAMIAATGIMRQVRRLPVEKDNDFEVRSSEGLLNIIKDNTIMIRSATVAIGLITLLGAAIGLMNIMLVSVTERTREIGIVKALGATQQYIRRLFLTEAVLICQAGGVLGIILGVLAGNLVGVFMQSPFIMPWNWILLGLIVCGLVGILAGYYPARRASLLDPIESLRYE